MTYWQRSLPNSRIQIKSFIFQEIKEINYWNLIHGRGSCRFCVNVNSQCLNSFKILWILNVDFKAHIHNLNN